MVFACYFGFGRESSWLGIVRLTVPLGRGSMDELVFFVALNQLPPPSPPSLTFAFLRLLAFCSPPPSSLSPLLSLYCAPHAFDTRNEPFELLLCSLERTTHHATLTLPWL